MAGLSTTNLTGLVVEATAERIEVEGFRFGDNPDGDKDAWRIWQESDFDAGSADAVTHALVYGRCPISVDPAGPRLVVEDPRQVVVAYSSDGRRDRLAALKVFTDEWTGAWYATLYLPDAIYRYEDVRQPRYSSTEPLWTLREVSGTPAVSANPFGEVPFFELRNRPLGRTRSEIANIVVPQLRLNQAVFNTDAVGEYGAFRQKWASGIEVPRDPVTGQPITPYEAGLTKLFVGRGGRQVRRLQRHRPVGLHLAGPGHRGAHRPRLPRPGDLLPVERGEPVRGCSGAARVRPREEVRAAREGLRAGVRGRDAAGVQVDR
jgi:hypothetical protein